MLKKTHKLIEGILVVLIALSIGGTLYIESLNERTACRAGWVEITEGEYEGYNKCITKSGERVQLCFDVYNSANTENYWCEKGKIIIIEEEDKQKLSYKASSGEIHCTSKGCAID